MSIRTFLLHYIQFFKSGNKQLKFDTFPGAKIISRETEVFKKLHFTQEQKLKIVDLIMQRFKDNSKVVNANSQYYIWQKEI